MPQLYQVALVNVQGLKCHTAALTAHLRLLQRKPELVCVTETHLDKAGEAAKLEEYDLVARRDREGKGGGGVCVFALKTVSKQVVLLERSETSERLWVAVHTELGPYLVANWYRPPSRNDTKKRPRSPELVTQEAQKQHLQFYSHRERNIAHRGKEENQT